MCNFEHIGRVLIFLEPKTSINCVFYNSSVQVDRGTLTVEALELLRLVPEGYIPLPHQVGGHRHVDGKLGAWYTNQS